MAAAVTLVTRLDRDGPKKINSALVTFDATYPATGESLSANDLGLARIDQVFANAASASSTTALVCVPAVAAGGATVKLRLHGGAASAVALAENATADMSGTTVNILAIGV